MGAIPGDPVVLRRTGQHYRETATAIRTAVADLEEIARPGAMVSLAIDRVREDAARLASEIGGAERRYAETGDALVDFAAALEAAQEEAERAERDAADAAADEQAASRRASALREELRGLAPDAEASETRTLERSISGLATAAEGFSAAGAAAEQRHADALAARDRAAEVAIGRIRSVVEGSDLNDSFWDDLWSSIGDFFEAVGQVLLAIAAAVVGAILAVVAAVLVLIAAVLVVVAALVLLGLAVVAALVVAAIALAALVIVVVAAAVLAFIAVAIIAGVLAITVALVLIVTAALALILATVVTLAVLILSSPLFWALVLSAVTFLGAVLAWRVAIEIFAPTPEVGEFAPDENDRQSLAAWQRANDVERMDSLDDFVAAEGFADMMGGESQTVVDIKRIEGEPPRYVVTLPSTQDWQAAGVFFGEDMNGDGAVNDLDTNIVLRLFPEVRTQYERAVMEAMRQAGIQPSDPVMLVGFSQGGILAGHLAANRSSEFNFQAVLAYGAPIDDMAIPPKTEVVSMQHDGDVVHTLDLTARPPDTDTWSTYSVPVPAGTNPTTGQPYDAQPHNNAAYEQTAQDLLSADPTIDDGFSEFFGEVVEQEQYAFSE
ncbi:hypothetical protein ASE14_07525 [Agromyces sp. Root81]|uniref:hypothetical protein n=1 Tax=Agromyces sp. Root81 TaxID=1736601 RepID=UPI0006F6E10B|nr:hypothetical protein [Agromyces sp. Root81]KRC60813.1 hypothetical protein ASE14_07525 [Agromyces sp. Root81]